MLDSFGWGLLMDHSYEDEMKPIDLSVDAAVELEEYKRNLRSDVPAMNALFRFIRTPTRAFGGKSVSLLADVRAYHLPRSDLQKLTAGS